LLKVKQIETYYGSIQALKSVSLEVQEGSIICLLGANGAGKTTLINTISGVNNPSRGEIIFSGKRIDRLSADKIVKLGISHVPQGREIFPFLTTKKNLELGAYIRKDKKAVAQDMEKIYGIFPILKERRNQQAGTLSGGEQQMLAIGRALMSRPKLLLLDEPSLGLAPLVVEEIYKVIQEIKASGTTIFLVEQNARMALSISSYGYIMELGEIVLEDTCKNLLCHDDVRRSYLGE
jgi:branched-chain amino acid transport system ATP-binding protein